MVVDYEDRYLVAKTEAFIKGSDLLGLKAQQDRVDGYLDECSRSIQDIRQHLEKAGEVPQKNADAFRSTTSMLFAMSCFPVLGFALMVSSRIGEFKAAFESSNQIYGALAAETIAKTRKFEKINKIMVINYPASMILAKAATRIEEFRNSSSVSQQNADQNGQ